MRFEPIPANFLSRPDAVLLSKRFSVANEVIPRLDLGYLDVNTGDPQVNDIVNAYNTLTPQISKSTVAINEETAISGYPTFDYVVRLNDFRIASGTIADGVLEISFDSEGDYLIEIIVGLASGYAEVTVNG